MSTFSDQWLDGLSDAEFLAACERADRENAREVSDFRSWLFNKPAEVAMGPTDAPHVDAQLAEIARVMMEEETPDISTARKAERFLASRLGLSTAEEERARERADRVLRHLEKRAE